MGQSKGERAELPNRSQVLENWQTPPADVYAVYQQRLQTAARVKAFVEPVVDAFAA